MEKLREIQIDIEQAIIDNYNCGGISENGFNELMDGNRKLGDYIDNPPEIKHETVEQWEDRTGETYPNSAPVYARYGEMIPRHEWALMEHHSIKGADQSTEEPLVEIIVATCYGKPDSIGG